MKQHFESSYVNGIDGFCIINKTESALKIVPYAPFYIYSEKNEITQGCINRIVDNLNKLAEHNAKLDAANKNGAS